MDTSPIQGQGINQDQSRARNLAAAATLELLNAREQEWLVAAEQRGLTTGMCASECVCSARAREFVYIGYVPSVFSVSIQTPARNICVAC